MASLKIQFLTAVTCILSLAASGFASGHQTVPPCPIRPSIAADLDANGYAKVTSALRQEVARDPHNAQAALWLARAYLDLGDYDQAVEFAERAVNLSPDCTESHFWLARSYALKADKDRSFLLARKAKLEYQAAVNLDPGNLAARRDLMEFYIQAPWVLGGSRDKAWAQVEAIAARDSTEGDLARAIYWRDLNKPSLAAAEYWKVLQAKPRGAEPYFQVADFYEWDGNPGAVETAVREASMIVPNDPRLDYYSAVARIMMQRDLAKAEQQLKDYLARTPQRDDFPAHAKAHDWLGRIYEILGKKQLAIDQYRVALRLSPDNRPAQDALKRLDTN